MLESLLYALPSLAVPLFTVLSGYILGLLGLILNAMSIYTYRLHPSKRNNLQRITTLYTYAYNGEYYGFLYGKGFLAYIYNVDGNRCTETFIYIMTTETKFNSINRDENVQPNNSYIIYDRHVPCYYDVNYTSRELTITHHNADNNQMDIINKIIDGYPSKKLLRFFYLW